MTNKYAEGYPRARYYGGCECVDLVEDLARDRLKEIFDRAFVNKKELPKSNPFLTLNQNVSYTISKVKETVND